MKKSTERLTEVLGWYGVAAIFGAYALLSFGVFTADNLWYHLLNLTGGAGILVDALADKDYQPVVLNAVWSLLAIYAIFRILM